MKISQCMIVKNEEKHIERALSWGKQIVSEQIVVDTGSTDRTVEIAKQMGARVYHFQWIDDFAAAKNFAISKAQYEWIAFLDADEYLLMGDGEKLLHYVEELQDTRCEGILTAWVNLDGEGQVMNVGTQCRVFRNQPDLRYDGKIHECLATEDEHSIQMADLTQEISIIHTGYGREELSQKDGRNLKLIQAELEKDPDDLRMLGYLGKEYMTMGEYPQAKEAFRRAITLMPEEMKGYYGVTTSEIMLRFLTLLAADQETDRAAVMRAYEHAVSWWPEDADYDYTVGQYLASMGDYKEGEKHLRRALELLGKYGHTSKSAVLSGHIQYAFEMLAICCYHNDDLPGCVSFTTAILKEDPYQMSTLKVMLTAFRKAGEMKGHGREDAKEVAAFLGGSFYDLRAEKDRSFILQAVAASGYKELGEVLKGAGR